MHDSAALQHAQTPPLLELDQVHKHYGQLTVVDGLSLRLMPGECYGIIGPNGAGKTTTIQLCLGLARPDAGQIRLMGQPVPKAARQARLRVGVVTQFDSLDPDFTVEENLLVFGRYFGLSDAELRPRLPQLLAFAALESKARARISELSGGMRRRLSLARALVNDPDLIFLDEPTTGLDPQARHLIWERLKVLTAQGKSLLLTTHFMDEAERLCHRILVLDHGRRIAEDTPRGLITAQVEAEVIEMDGEGLDEAERLLRPHVQRMERSGDGLFAYTAQSAAALRALEALPGLRVLHRRANLEDVFLKLTGRQLRD
ncbi:ATP-binding cassette domain-containing protein [Thiomonas intermedia]|uniref:ATP-binding cassette domain-containing protein n=1 Tax=Thiomonas intermedia TaxID=926 RepID=UPI0009A4FD84|nr:ATP-binding cassette domain-containing protein [Thiomonas intermedia]